MVPKRALACPKQGEQEKEVTKIIAQSRAWTISKTKSYSENENRAQTEGRPVTRLEL